MNNTKKTLSAGPDFLILGTAKSGTTTLFTMLDSMPEFSGSINKEIRFFSMDYYYNQGVDWYHSQFNERKEGLRFEATPHYLYFPAVPERLQSYQDQVQREIKFIVLLREPAARAYSAWNMERSYHQNNPMEIIENHYAYYNPDIRKSLSDLLLQSEFPTFQQAVMDDIRRLHNHDRLLEPSYVRKGLYSEQIARWLNWFDPKYFLFIEFQELLQPQSVLQRIAEFLDVKIEPLPVPPQNLHLYQGTYPAPADEIRDTIKMLNELYFPYNENLFRQIGTRFNWND